MVCSVNNCDIPLINQKKKKNLQIIERLFFYFNDDVILLSIILNGNTLVCLRSLSNNFPFPNIYKQDGCLVHYVLTTIHVDNSDTTFGIRPYRIYQYLSLPYILLLLPTGCVFIPFNPFPTRYILSIRFYYR